jgi:hypothetical protein
MTLTIADLVTDGEVVCVAVAALAQRLNVLQRGGFARHMFAADPARHGAVKLAGDRLVDLVAGKAQSAHVYLGPGYRRLASRASACSMNESCHCDGNWLTAPDSPTGLALSPLKPELRALAC